MPQPGILYNQLRHIRSFLFMGVFAMTCSSHDAAGSEGTIRRPAVAGMFYSATAEALRAEVTRYLEQTPKQAIDGTILAAMAPHAGYHYSARVAAHVHQAIRDIPIDTMVIIGHDAHARGVIALLSEADHFATPLGPVAVDRTMVQALLAEDPGIITHERIHRQDHTIEVHLPFLKLLHPDCRIVPVMFGQPDLASCRRFAAAIRKVSGTRRVFVLASTDLSHYPDYERARKLDQETMQFVETLDPAGLFKHLGAIEKAGDPTVQTAMCASGGVGTAMLLAEELGATRAQILCMANSGDTPPTDHSRVVGYAAAVFVRPTPAAGEPPPGAADKGDFRISAAAQNELLTLARKRIEAATREEKLSYRPAEGLSELLQQAPVFVTLHRHGDLRGCIGMTKAHGELWRAVYDMAYSAAFEDPRFKPLQAEELAELHIEISVLSPLQRVASAADIVPHQHGVVVRRGFRSGLFLPQVWEQLPDKEKFLDILCSQKADLPADAWKDRGTELLVFTVFAFAETERP